MFLKKYFVLLVLLSSCETFLFQTNFSHFIQHRIIMKHQNDKVEKQLKGGRKIFFMHHSQRLQG